MSIVSMLGNAGLDQRYHSLCVSKILSIKLDLLLHFWGPDYYGTLEDLVCKYLENRGELEIFRLVQVNLKEFNMNIPQYVSSSLLTMYVAQSRNSAQSLNSLELKQR